MDFTKQLLRWNANDNQRTMPWKGVKDPYKIWLSEVILQQTRVEQGWAYYENFIAHFPDIQALAAAADQDVFKLWEGLGYYNRCKNLLYTARYIATTLDGTFPVLYEEVLALKGIGPYTAAAICSFAYNQAFAVVDGNVFRVLSRYFGIEIPIDSTEGKQRFSELATEVLDKKNPGIYNQAIMDFGATVCTPAVPDCTCCPLQKGCIAHNTGKVNQLPVKEKILTKKTRYFSWFVLSVKDEILLHLRSGKDIWQNLFEFYLIETENKPNWDEASVNDWTQKQFGALPSALTIFPAQKQQLTHQSIHAVFVEINLPLKPENIQQQLWVRKKDLKKYAFPKMPKSFVDNHLSK